LTNKWAWNMILRKIYNALEMQNAALFLQISL